MDHLAALYASVKGRMIMGRSTYQAEAPPPPIKRRLGKSARRGRKHAATRPSTKFTIQYFRKGKRTKPLTFELSSLQQARKVARIAGEFRGTSVQSFTITSEDGRSETWLYLEGTWRQKRR
jgi:hypothetical protein